jgi:hypothetical protein
VAVFFTSSLKHRGIKYLLQIALAEFAGVSGWKERNKTYPMSYRTTTRCNIEQTSLIPEIRSETTRTGGKSYIFM